MRYRTLGFSTQDGWNFRGAYPTLTEARVNLVADAPTGCFPHYAIVELRGNALRFMETDYPKGAGPLMDDAAFNRVASAL